MKKESGASGSRLVVETADLDARAITRLRVLNCIRDAGEASRTEIATRLRLSPATVTFVTAGLMKGDLIEEVTTPDTTPAAKRGRPRVALRLKDGMYYVAGLKVARHTISILILDFDGTEVLHREFPLDAPQMSETDLVKAICDNISTCCQDLEGGIERLAGVSIGLAGQVDSAKRFVHWSPSLLERNIDLGPLLDAHLPCSAIVENDANLVAKAEQLFGEAQGINNFLVVTIEHGVGLGIVLAGRLHRGERGCGAEFGHTKVALNGAVCQCGQHGCLEAYVGTYALLERASQGLGEERVDSVSTLSKMATDGNAAAQAVLHEAGQMFALGLSNLINLFDPERIILSGLEHHIAHLNSKDVMEQISNNVVNVDAPLPDIRVHHWDHRMWARGAAAMGIDHVSAVKVKDLGKDVS